MPRPAYSNDKRESIEKRIREEALKLFARNGYRNVSLRTIAKALGWSATALYRYYENKDALLAAVRAEGFERMEQTIASARDNATDSIAAVRAAIRGYLRFATEEPNLFRLLYELDQADVEERPNVGTARKKAFSQAVSLAKYVMEETGQPGDPNQLAHILWISCHGLATLALAHQLDLGQSLEDLIEPTTQTLLNGLMAQQGNNHV